MAPEKEPPSTGDAGQGRAPAGMEAHGRRRQDVAAARRAQARRERNRVLAMVLGGVAVLTVFPVAVTLLVNAVDGAPSAAREVAGVEPFTPSRDHVTTPVQYPQTLPAGGDHSPVWLNCGVYPEPVPDEQAVHSLEHGAVWVTYHPDLPAADVDALVARLPDTYTLLSPYPDLPAPVVASAWGRQLRLDGPDDPRLTDS